MLDFLTSLSAVEIVAERKAAVLKDQHLMSESSADLAVVIPDVQMASCFA